MSISSPKKNDVLFENPLIDMGAANMCRVAIVCFAHPGTWELDIRRMIGTKAAPVFTTQGARFDMRPELVDRLIEALQAAKSAYLAATASPVQVAEPSKSVNSAI